MTYAKNYAPLLEGLHADSVDILASAIASKDGLMVANHPKNTHTEDRMAAMSAAMLSLGDRIIDELLDGITDRVVIQSSVGYVVVSAVTADMLLTVIARSNANLAMVFHDIKNFAEKMHMLVMK